MYLSISWVNIEGGYIILAEEMDKCKKYYINKGEIKCMKMIKMK